VAIVGVMNLEINMWQDTTVLSDLVGPNKKLWTTSHWDRFIVRVLAVVPKHLGH
jgi:hypothetical protein